MTKHFKPIFTITNRITAGLTRIERARGFLEAATLSEAWVSAYFGTSRPSISAERERPLRVSASAQFGARAGSPQEGVSVVRWIAATGVREREPRLAGVPFGA